MDSGEECDGDGSCPFDGQECLDDCTCVDGSVVVAEQADTLEVDSDDFVSAMTVSL